MMKKNNEFFDYEEQHLMVFEAIDHQMHAIHLIGCRKQNKKKPNNH